MFQFHIRTLFFVSALIYSYCSFAWWDAGHKLVAEIAYQQLDHHSQTELVQLYEVMHRDYPELTQPIDLAIWPDLIRKQTVDAYTHWHYIDTPYQSDETTSTLTLDTDNALWALQQINTTLLSDKTKLIERARFTAFLIHIVGDLHQPLHTISRISKEHPEGDMGGNLFLVIDPKHEESLISLHSLWDSNFGLFKRMSDQEIQQLAQEIIARYPKNHFSDQELNASASVWTNESYELAKNWVYTTAEHQKPSMAYQERSQEMIHQRIAIAGYRLARLLEQYTAIK